MKFLILASAFLVCVSAQRPYYAGTGPKGRPELASRFREDEASSSTANIANRLGDETSTTAKIPVDALGDGELVDRLSQWPREHQPFWLLNAEHIEAARNSPPPPQPQGVQSRFGEGGAAPLRPAEPRSSFLPPLN